jgi:hypothetical protein
MPQAVKSIGARKAGCFTDLIPGITEVFFHTASRAISSPVKNSVTLLSSFGFFTFSVGGFPVFSIEIVGHPGLAFVNLGPGQVFIPHIVLGCDFLNPGIGNVELSSEHIALYG